MNTKQRILLFVIGLISMFGWSQNAFVSGGMRYSLALAADGKVITWGDNTSGQLGRQTMKSTSVQISKTSSIVIPYDDVPTTITLKDKAGADLKIKALDAGTGSHAIAIATDSTVWTWGNNAHGQLGNGFGNYGRYKTKCINIKLVESSGLIVDSICNKTRPQQVVAGETAKAGSEYTSTLKSVISVTGAGTASFAIVRNPTTKKTNLVSWGSNQATAPMASDGLLGNGLPASSLAGSAYPVYVKYKNKTGALVPLENIIAVDASETSCFALVDDDNDGDPTTGTVYGWGSNYQNSISPTLDPYKGVLYATPITTDANGTQPLVGIKSISAGLLFLLAYDKAGNAWTVGSEWCPSSSTNQETPRGNGSRAFQNVKYAAKVVAGDESKYISIANMSNVIAVAAGEQTAMAMVDMTVGKNRSNYVLSWGSSYGANELPTRVNVNALGNGGDSATYLPRMVYRLDWRTGKKVLIDSVTSISDGGGVMFAIRLEKDKNGALVNQLYVTGANGAGQLGYPIANNGGVNVFTKLDIPAVGPLAMPCAIARLDKTELCLLSSKESSATNALTPTTHFVWERFDSTGAKNQGVPAWYEVYKYTKSNVSNADNTKWTFDAAGNDKARFLADRTGWLRVSIYDTRANLGLGNCPVSRDSTLITNVAIPFTAQLDTAWMEKQDDGSTADWGMQHRFSIVDPSYSSTAAKGDLIVYNSETSTEVLARANKENAYTVDIKSEKITSFVNDSTVQYWVADSIRFADTVLNKRLPPLSTTTSIGGLNINSTDGLSGKAMAVAATHDFVLKSFDVNLKGMQNIADTVYITPVIYKANRVLLGNSYNYQLGAIVSTDAKQEVIIKTQNTTKITVNCATLLAGNIDNPLYYVVRFKAVPKVKGHYFDFQAPNYQVTNPISDANNVMQVVAVGNVSSMVLQTASQEPTFFNLVVEKTTNYPCGRVPVLARKFWRCRKPFYGNDSALLAPSLVCAGSAVTVKSPKTTYPDKISFAWYNAAPLANSLAFKTQSTGDSSIHTFTAGNKDTTLSFYMIAWDKRYDKVKKCTDTAKVTIAVHKTNYQLSGGGYFCERSISPNVSVQLGKVASDTTGKTPWKIFYHFNGTNIGAPTAYTVMSAAKEQVHTFANLGAGLFVLDSVSDKYCSTKAVAADTIRNSQIVIDSVWNSKSIYKYCNGSTRPSIAVNTMKGNTTKTYTWMYKANGSSSFTAIPKLTTILSTASAGQYYVKFTSATGTVSCTEQTAVKTVTRYPQPQFVLENANTYCEGNTIVPISLKITADTLLSGKYGAWSLTPSVNGSALAAISVAADANLPSVNLGSAAGTYTAVLKNTVTGCSSAITPSANLIINKKSINAITATACKEYIYNSKTYTSSGVYSIVYKNAAGCDSTVTLNLTILQPSSKSITVSACKEYVYNGKTYITSGVYPVVLKNAVGCDSTVTLNLTILKPSTNTINATVCKQYVYNSKIYSASGVYTVVLKNAVGCDSTVTLNLNILKPSVNNLNVKACKEYVYNGKAYTNSGTYTAILKNAVGCDSTVTLNVTILKPSVNSITVNACKEYTYNGKTYITSGVYPVVLKNAVGCDSTVTLNLTINKYQRDTIRKTSCKPVLFAGKLRTTSGTYSDTVVNATTCDAITVLVLNIGSEVVNSINITACKTYTFSNKIITTSGVYKDTIQRPGDCDSIVILHLSINKYVYDTLQFTNLRRITDTIHYENMVYRRNDTIVNPQSFDTVRTTYTYEKLYAIDTINASICKTFTYNNKTYNAAGTYHDTIIRPHYSVYVTLNISNKQASLKTITASACKFYNLNGVVYNKSGIYRDTLTTASGCDSVVELRVTISGAIIHQISATTCKSYNFNGVILDKTGQYTDTVQTASGCDSVVVLHLTITGPITNEISQTACKSFNFNGVVYTTSGTYKDTVQTAGGCDSIITLHLKIENYVALTKNFVACKSVTYNGKIYTQTGQFKDTIRNASGCDTAVVLNVKISDPIVYSYNVTACKSYSFNGQLLDTSGEYTDTIQTAGGCDSIVTLKLTIGGTIINKVNVTSCKFYNFNGFICAQSGEYKDTIQTADGCDSVVVMQVKINNPVVNEIRITACDSYQFNGLLCTQSGDYIDTLQTSNGCDSVVTLHLTINKTAWKTLEIIACKSYTFHGKLLTKTGEYTDTLKTTKGCDSLVTLKLTIDNYVVKIVTVNDYYPYTFNGKTYSKTGYYADTLVNPNGCDTIVSLNITITPKAPDVTNLKSKLTIAETYYTKSVDTASNISAANKLELQNAIAAARAIILSVAQSTQAYPTQDSVDKHIAALDTALAHCNYSTKKPVVYYNFAVTACDYYYFAGTTYTESGVYADTVELATKDSIATLTLTITEIPARPLIASSEVKTCSKDAAYRGISATSTHKINWYAKSSKNLDSLIGFSMPKAGSDVHLFAPTGAPTKDLLIKAQAINGECLSGFSNTQLSIVIAPKPSVEGSVKLLAPVVGVTYTLKKSNITNFTTWYCTRPYIFVSADSSAIKTNFIAEGLDTVKVIETYKDTDFSCSDTAMLFITVTAKTDLASIAQTSSMLLLPNPSTGDFVAQLTNNTSSICFVRLIAADGKEISYPSVIVDNQVYIQSHLAVGSYKVIIETVNKVYSATIVIQ